MAADDPLTTLTGDIELDAGQTLAEPGPTLIGVLASFGSTIEGAGTLATAGTTTLVAQPSSGLTDLFIGDGLAWNNTGTVDDGGSIEFGLASGDTDSIVNASGATFALTSDAAVIVKRLLVSGASATFTNDGLLTKTGGTATSVIDATIDSTGIIQATTGTLAFGSGGDISGALDTASDADIAFAGGSFALSETTIGANLVLDGGAVTLQTPATIAGSLTESAGTLDVASDSALSGSLTATSGEIFIASDHTLTLGGPVTLGSDEVNPDIAGPGTLATTGTVDQCRPDRERRHGNVDDLRGHDQHGHDRRPDRHARPDRSRGRCRRDQDRRRRDRRSGRDERTNRHLHR